jgi:hypothetical protein
MGSKHSYQNRRPKLQQDRRPLWFCSSYLIKSFNGIVQIFFTTVMSPTPLLIYIYGSGHAHIIPFDLCVYWEYLMKNICSVTHTASIWLTMYLGINRYLGVYISHVASGILWHIFRINESTQVKQNGQNINKENCFR